MSEKSKPREIEDEDLEQVNAAGSPFAKIKPKLSANLQRAAAGGRHAGLRDVGVRVPGARKAGIRIKGIKDS